MERIAVYARVSTQDQHPEAQLDALRSYARARGLEIAGEYVDHGVSGTRARRPALDRLQADALRRRFDGVAVVKLDRLARSVRHLTALAAEWEALGIDLVVLDQAIDTSVPTGKLLFHVLASIAEFERSLIVERVTAGLRAARRRGAAIGRRRKLDREHLKRLARLHRAGRSHRAIAAMLEVSKTTVARELAQLQDA